MTEPNRNFHQELQVQRLEAAFREGRDAKEREAFLRKHAQSVERNIPLAENFLLEFSDKFLKPLTLEEDNSVVTALDVKEDDEVAIFRVINDAFKLFKANRLEGRTEVRNLSGYDAAEGTRSFTTSVIFLKVQTEVGKDGLELIDQFSDAWDKYKAEDFAKKSNLPLGMLSHLISRKGKIFTPSTPAQDLVTVGGSINEVPQSELKDVQVSHFEGELENNDNFNGNIMITWDIDHSLPVSIFIYGNKGILGEYYSFDFYFQTEEADANPFPLLPFGVSKSDVTISFEKDELTARFLAHSSYTDKKYEEIMKMKKIGHLKNHEGKDITVWASNRKWNSFTELE